MVQLKESELANRIVVEWMTHVPMLTEEAGGGHDFDHADWAFKQFCANEIKRARTFAQAEANRNAFGQTWLHVEFAPGDDPREWQWERDCSQDQIFEAEAQ